MPERSTFHSVFTIDSEIAGAVFLAVIILMGVAFGLSRRRKKRGENPSHRHEWSVFEGLYTLGVALMAVFLVWFSLTNNTKETSFNRKRPQLVVLQAGHNDIGVAPTVEAAHVQAVVDAIRRQAPQARLALVTVFAGTASPSAAARTDSTIIAAARRADPAVVVVSPLRLRWHYPTIADHLHPDQAGEVWLAAHVARRLGGADLVHVAGGSRGADVDVSTSCAGRGSA